MTSNVNLEGSSSLIIDFFECSLHNILYQRGLYPADEFDIKTKHGLKVYVSSNSDVLSYINNLSTQLKPWLNDNKVEQIVLVIKSKDTLKVLERWNFNIKSNKCLNETNSPEKIAALEKSNINQMRSVIRQINASISFLPELDQEDCTFNVLVHTTNDVEVPSTWGDSEPNLIKEEVETVKLNPFDTLDYNVDTLVEYPLDDNNV